MRHKLTRKQMLWTFIALFLAGISAYSMLKASGFFPEPAVYEVLFAVILIIALGSSKLSYYGLLLPIALGYACYAPIGLSFGAPSYQYIASLLATDLLESREFLSQLPVVNYFIAAEIILAVVFFRKITQKHHINFLDNRTFVIGSLIVALFTLSPFKFFHEFIAESIKVKEELATLNSSKSILSEWGISTLNENSGYDDYVLVIGESARKDYHHAYGYPIPNTPFMSEAKGTLIDGFTAGGTNTIASLKLLLTKPDTKMWEADYRLGLIDLVKSAGIRTYWISNQGYLGKFDTPISAIANRSDERIFLKSGDSFSQNISDFALLPKFKDVLVQPTQNKRFIVLHLYGSHPITCDRLNDYPKIFDDSRIAKKYHNVNCYVSSIKKTDELLEKFYNELRINQEKRGRSFSMIYLSDHGLIHSEDSQGGIHILNTAFSKYHFDVPLFKISGDDTERHVYKVFKSGLNFTDGIAKWIGISNPKLNATADLFSNKNDETDYGLKQRIEEIQAKPDPAIIIRAK